ncbi:amidohydrolase family protein [Propionibacteriaceae bacterium Y2011]
MFVDVHTHCLAHEHWGPEWDDNWKPVYHREWEDVRPEDYDRDMAAAGVDVAFVFGLRATKAGVLIPNRFVADFCRRTTTRTVGFASLDLSDDDVMEQFAEGLELGLRGVKLYPVLAGFDPRDERHDAFYRAATEAGVVVLWHMGASPSKAADLRWADPLLVDVVAARHPGLTQIIAHMGHPWQREAFLVCRKNPRVFTDVSASWARPFDAFHALVRSQEWGVTDKLLFGSDYPFWTPAEAAAGLREIASMTAGTLPGVNPDTVESMLAGDPLARLGLSA